MNSARRFRLWVMVLGLGLAAVARAQQPGPLSRPVQLTPGRRPLGAVLAELAHQAQLPLSYSSSLVPLSHRCQVSPGPPRPLGIVLREVLNAEHLSGGLLDGQLVLWPDRATPPPGITPLPGPVAPSRIAGSSPGRSAAVTVSTKPAVAHITATTPSTRTLSTKTGKGRTATSFAASVSRLPAPYSPARAARSQVARAKPASLTESGRASRVRSTRGLLTAQGEAARQLIGAASRELAPLPPRPAAVLVAAAPVPPLAVVPLVDGPGSPAAARPVPGPPRLRGLYLHAEAWGSESLPVGLTAKVGMPRAYLLLGVALAPAGRQTGPAVGVGLGTAGRARGRFTPNLDVLAWRAGADHDQETSPTLLVQLRPQLTWQVRPGSRLALLAGPTLNLATTRQRGPQTQRWDFAHDQWLWVNQANGESPLRFWPGVQVGMRF